MYKYQNSRERRIKQHSILHENKLVSDMIESRTNRRKHSLHLDRKYLDSQLEKQHNANDEEADSKFVIFWFLSFLVQHLREKCWVNLQLH